MSRTLIVQGGGFRTGFTAGILDAFMAMDFFPFDRIIGVSGGAISASYYLSEQFGSCVESMRILAKDKEFVNIKYVVRDRGYMNIDYLGVVANENVPFDTIGALHKAKQMDVRFVATSRVTGKPVYLSPTQDDWIDLVIASSTLPFVTKGIQKVRGMELMDGGWSDPLPIEWAIQQGSTDVLILRTSHLDQKIVQTWPDYLASFYFKKSPDLSACFASAHQVYNRTLDFLSTPIEDVQIEQIWPEQGLKCGTYNYSVESIDIDYRYGLNLGLTYVRDKRLGHSAIAKSK